MPPVVLICDNEESLRALIRASLAPGGYELVEARDGDESLALAQERHPDLIVLDVMMPGRTGLEVLAELRKDEAFTHTPVIVLTARAQVTDRDAAETAGATRFVSKPFSPIDLASTVAEVLAAKV